MTLALILAAFTLSAAAQEEAPAAGLPDLPPSLEETLASGRDLSDAAMREASSAYLTGEYGTALMHAERAAAAGEARGATMAGHIRLHGLNGRQDDEAAVRWFRRAAELGEPDALVILARLADEGRGGLDRFEAGELYRAAAQGGDSRGALEYGLHLQNRNDPNLASEALQWLSLAAEAGDEDAFGPYAAALDDWVHGPRDPARALPWYERAAENGDAASALQAGLMHMTGEAGAPDAARGAALIAMSAELGLPAAMGQRALILFQGTGGGAPDSERAAGWARQGAEAGDPESQFLYAYALATGDGVSRDLERAYFWALRAGYPGEDSLADDPDRTQLEAALEQALPEDSVRSIAEEAEAWTPPRLRLNPGG